ncbi:hypothetical protein KR009_002216 [Drosophila setifemur]|nr:hypothetical protein KR009_002216 [Drosophila setifemur]
MNISSMTHLLVLLVPLILLICVHICSAQPWWNTNEAGYDASLDPVAFSMSFVQDQVRKTRYNFSPESMIKNRNRKSSKFRYRKPMPCAPNRVLRKKCHKKLLRRRQKLVARERYSNRRQ